MSFTKKINVNDGSGQKFEDNTVGELQFDMKPEVGSFNAVTSDAVARAVAGASGEVPQVTESDNGKVLKAIYDEGGPAVEWGEGVTVDQTYDATSANAQSGVAVAGAIANVNAVPASTALDENKVLTVNSSGNAEWATPAAPTVDQTYNSASTNAQSGTAVAGAIAGVNQVPASTSGDSGKVLTVNSQGTAEWGTSAAGVVYVTTSTSYEDVLAAHTAGKQVVFSQGRFLYVLINYDPTQGHYQHPGVFLFAQWTGSTIDGYTYVLAGDLSIDMYTCYRNKNNATMWSHDTKYPVPAVSTGDSGKVLKVNSSGKWAAATINEVPAFDPVQDVGKVLQVTANGLEWVALSSNTNP